MKKMIFLVCAGTLLLAIASAPLSAQASAPATGAAAGAVKQMGSIRTIAGSDLSLMTDQGAALAVKVQSGARLLRLAPGQTDLKSAAPIQLTDLQVGDRVLVRGKLASDGIVVEATTVVVMKQQEIAQMKQLELLDWQKRGVGGLVQQVNIEDGKITISVGATGGVKSVVISTAPKTTFKRYSPDSVKWADATTATIGDIHPGDQLRAKGNKNEDGTQIVAEEIVAGTFRNIAGLITSIDSAQNTLTVQDLATKKPVTVKITADSQMKQLPVQMAQGLAMRMKNMTTVTKTEATPAESARARGGDLNQALTRLPAATLGDLQKGEAVMIVTTQGSSSESPVALTLLGGVEAILTASPSGKGADTFLTPWSLASAPASDQ
jgi:transcription antitermination factor NusG